MTSRDHEAGREHPHPAILHELLDGELDPEAEARAHGHLEECASCREAFRELAELRNRARALPREVEPARDLWPGIEARLRMKAEGASSSPSSGQRSLDRRAGSAKRRPKPAGLAWALAAAAGLAAIVAGTLLFTGAPNRTGNAPSVAGSEPTAHFASELRDLEEAYRPAIEELRGLVDSRELTPETRAVLEENLAVIERAIEESQQAVRTDPQGHLALNNLRRMYDAKVEVLRTVAVRP